MNMGKRFLLTLISIFIFASAALAYENPRWMHMPITVYIPKDTNAVAQNAFKTWQSVSSGTVRFIYKDSANLGKLCNIRVEVIDTPLGDNGYSVEQTAMMFDKTGYYQKNGFFYKTTIKISTKDANNKNISNSKMQAIALKAVGEAIGIKPVKDDTVLMSLSDDLKVKKITSKDLDALNKIYKSDTKYVK